MPEPRYRGESWQHSRTRADLAAAEAEQRAEAERAERARAARQRTAPRDARPVPPPPSPTAPAEPIREPTPPRRYAWHGGAHPHDFRMQPLNESDPR